MADSTETPKQAEAEKPQPNGPGLMLLFGLIAVGVAIWCGNDYFFNEKMSSGTIWFNGVGMAVSIVLAIYCFVMAYVRSRKSAAAANAQKPPEAGALDEAASSDMARAIESIEVSRASNDSLY